MTTQVTNSQQVQKTNKVGVIIPVYGEGEPILWVLRRFAKGMVSIICLVVDVPKKQEMDKVRALAEKIGIPVHIIKNRERRGVGYCLKQGLRYLRESNLSVAVIMAGNGKDDPGEMVRLIAPVIRGESDYVQGSRYLEGGRRERMPLTRQVFNRFFPSLWTVLTGKKCTDVTNGYRCYKLSIFNDHRINLDQNWLDGYSLEYYLHYKVLALGYKMREVPVTKTYPFGHRGGYSKIQPLKDWWPIFSPLVLLFLGVRK